LKIWRIVVGLAMAWGLTTLAFVLEGGKVGFLLQLTALTIVVGVVGGLVLVASARKDVTATDLLVKAKRYCYASVWIGTLMGAASVVTFYDFPLDTPAKVDTFMKALGLVLVLPLYGVWCAMIVDAFIPERAEL